MADRVSAEEARDVLVATRSLTLLVADALAFSPKLSERGRGVLVGALRHAVTKPVTQADEEAWMQRMLDAGLQITAAFNPARWPAERSPGRASTAPEASDGGRV